MEKSSYTRCVPDILIDMSDSYFNTPEGKVAKEVACQFISRKVGRHTKHAIRKEVEILLRLAKEIEKDYGMTLNNMCNRLDINSNENAQSYFVFSTIANEILVNGDENWGRVIILHAFAAKLAEKCKQTNNEQMIENIIYWLSCFIAKKSTWIRDYGRGWNGFIDQFCEPRQNHKDNNWFQGLFAATVSFGTLAALLFIKNS